MNLFRERGRDGEDGEGGGEEKQRVKRTEEDMREGGETNKNVSMDRREGGREKVQRNVNK